jgi:hypothetical protein
MTNLIVGLICLALGAWGVVAWWDEFGVLLRGLVPIVFLLVGLAAIGAGMKSKAASRTEGEEEDRNAPDEDASVHPLRKTG